MKFEKNQDFIQIAEQKIALTNMTAIQFIEYLNKQTY